MSVIPFVVFCRPLQTEIQRECFYLNTANWGIMKTAPLVQQDCLMMDLEIVARRS